MSKLLEELNNPFNACAHKQQCIDKIAELELAIAELEQGAGTERMEAARVKAALATRDKEYQLEHDLRVELEQELESCAEKARQWDMHNCTTHAMNLAEKNRRLRQAIQNTLDTGMERYIRDVLEE